MAKGDVYKLNLPYFLQVGKKRYPCNLNTYRNAHYRLTNAMKKRFKHEVEDQIRELPPLEKIQIHYKIYYENKRKFDIDNVMSVISKFAQDAIVETGILPDDNYEHIVKIAGSFGGVDKDNPRVEMWIKEV